MNISNKITAHEAKLGKEHLLLCFELTKSILKQVFCFLDFFLQLCYNLPLFFIQTHHIGI